MLRGLILRMLYLKARIQYRNINYRGWCVIHSFPGSSIRLGGGFLCSLALVVICLDYISVVLL